MQFDATIGGETLACGATYAGLGAKKASLKITDLRFYISNPKLTFEDGSSVAASLPDDGVWQGQNVGLVSFGYNCSAEAAKDINRSLKLSAVLTSAQKPKGLCFDLGLPFELNHADNANAVSPLNSSGMFWVWQSGHKFLRLDGVADPAGVAAGFNVHLGSTGCTSSVATQAPNTACTYTNRPQICFDAFDFAQDKATLLVDRLVEEVDLAVNTPKTAPGCMSGNNDPECKTILPKLGVDFTYNDGAGIIEVFKSAESVFVRR